MLMESEMREFFDKILNDWTGLTEASNRVEALAQQVQDLSNQVGMLRTENDNLKRDVAEAWDYSHRMEARVQELDQRVHDSQEHARVLQETIVNSNSRVNDLTRQNEEAVATVDYVTRERDAANSTVRDYEVQVADLRQQLEEVTRNRDEWKADAQKNAETIVQLNATLSRVQSILNPSSNVEHFPQYNVG